MNWTDLKEPELKQAVVEYLSPDFFLKDGDAFDTPRCTHIYTQQLLRPDFICYPKNELIKRSGFPNLMFFIEVKDCVGGNGNSRCNEVGWQCRRYMQCVVNGRLPSFVMVFPPFATLTASSEYASGFSGYMQNERIGELYLSVQDDKKSYKMKFASSVYYDSADGRKNFKLLDNKFIGIAA